jgi:hypothetical protein
LFGSGAKYFEQVSNGYFFHDIYKKLNDIKCEFCWSEGVDLVPKLNVIDFQMTHIFK